MLICREVISLQGVTGSPNFKAAQEWFAFEQEYDKGHTLLYETDKHPIDVPSAYDGKPATIWSDAGNNGSHLCEGNIVKYCGTDGEYEHYNFMKPDPSTGKLTQFLSMGYDPAQESWYYSKSFVDFTYISKAEFDEMVNSYTVMDIGMRPIGEYPFF